MSTITTTPNGLTVEESSGFIRFTLPSWLSTKQRREFKTALDAHFVALVDSVRTGMECPHWCDESHADTEGVVIHRRRRTLGVSEIEVSQSSNDSEPEFLIQCAFVDADDASALANELAALVEFVKGGRS